MAVPEAGSHPSLLLARYQALLEVTLALLVHARSEDWDALEVLLPEQERIMANLAPVTELVAADNSVDDIAQLLRNIDTANQELMYRIGVRQGEIQRMTGEVSVARNNVNRLGRAYRY